MSDPKIHYADHLEQAVGTALETAGIEFLHNHNDLDFYLPKFDVYIEVKQFHADRIARQMASRDNVIAVQGAKSIELITRLLLAPAAQPVAPEREEERMSAASQWFDGLSDGKRQHYIDTFPRLTVRGLYEQVMSETSPSAENKGASGSADGLSKKGGEG